MQCGMLETKYDNQRIPSILLYKAHQSQNIDGSRLVL